MRKTFLLPALLGTLFLASPALAAEPTLSPGSSGVPVAILQADLGNIGLYHGPTDGIFNSLTAQAVSAFKQGFGLGGGLATVDSGTWSTLNAYLENRFNPVSGSLGSTAVTIGDIGPAVVELQGDLSQLGYDPGPANGVFMYRTGRALMRFQADHGLPVTEVADHRTVAAIIRAMDNQDPTSQSAAAAEPAEIDGHRVLKVIHLVATAYGPSLADNFPYGPTDYFGQPLQSGMVAVDPSVIPLKTYLYIRGYSSPELPSGGFLARAMDTGDAIQGDRVDIFLNASPSQVAAFGIQPVTAYILAN